MDARMDAAEAACLEPKLGAKSPSIEDSNRGSQEENGAADHLSERSDASFATAEPNRPQAPAGKLKKTAFKLFGGKRSICTLPSFFGGKNKGQGKAASKKGLSKSKTHDGISDVRYEDSEHLRGSLDGGTGFPSPQLPTSQSTLLGAEANRRVGFIHPSTSLSGSSEGFEKKTGGDKSLFLPRSKKGLRGFFNSIRRHRKNKTAEPEKTELQEWTTRDVVEESQAKAEDHRGVGTQQSTDKGDPKCSPLPSERKENLCGDASPGSLGELREKDQPATGERVSMGDTTRVAASCQGSQDAELDTDNVFCTSATFCDLPDALQAEYLDNSPPCVPSGDQLSFMFGDVTSLKSFDSLTGCGDIIAEPDIDSIAGSSASAERSRDAAKRSSCLVTYQGGGEEMAMPDEIEEYLQQVWEGAAKAGETYETDLPELMDECEHQGANGAKQETRLCVEGVDLLTPHSDQQESAPNSDEGYYDSTTPGPEEESGEGLEEVKKDRLPRDSYSGDALYEFYETDDALLSPSHGDESWFDRKVSPPDIVGHFFDFGLPDEKDLVRMMGRKGEVMETEEERMAAIQKQLLYWELQREPTLKHLEMIRKDQHSREKLHAEHKMEVGGLLGKSQSCLGCEEISQAEIATESRDCKDLQEMLYLEKRYSPDCFMQFVGNGSALDAEAECTMLESHALSGLALEKPVAYPFYQEHSCRGSPPNEQPSRAEADSRETLKPESPCKLEQAAVNFSQALVEFTSSGTLFSSLSESIGSSDSGSAFTQNFPSLPTMVTFDIVDVEQDGEGECEQHLEMNMNEELATSFEAFDDSYVPKESFTECDERMFTGYPQGSFQGGNWGIASLPRRLRLQELCPPLPEPLSLCRRSRSLDTESLEFELASLQLSKNGFKPCELWSQWSGCKKDPLSPGLCAGQASAPCSPEGKGEETGAFSWTGLQNVPTGEEFSSRDAKLWDRDFNHQSFRSVWGGLEGSDLAQNSVKVSGKPYTDGDPDRGFLAPRPMARPSNLPLQTPGAPQTGCPSHRLGVGDSAAKKLAWVLPLGERPAGGPPSFDFAPSPEKPAAYRPVGVDAKNVLASQQAEMLRPL
ncbi:APC membrane recruitment protein 1 [Sceloporus undulatus]|uniref:APC membrane recruitment protein 1 n=1 Tax=Sceloporus undulatus TaxID=8520 RepID=UPI001C4D4052|nr:APC membrane recruitment protein 1 [Sceloporus undulatus]